jgi:regulator of nonsense transcripts 2
LDLKLFVPQVLLGEKKNHNELFKQEEKESVEVAESVTPSLSDPASSSETTSSSHEEHAKLAEDDEEEDNAADSKEGLSGKAAIDSILVRLPLALSRDTIDPLSVEFCYHNFKSARKRLAKHMLAVPRQRSDILPYYARYIANLFPYIPEIGVQVVEAVSAVFCSLYL